MFRSGNPPGGSGQVFDFPRMSDRTVGRPVDRQARRNPALANSPQSAVSVPALPGGCHRHRHSSGCRHFPARKALRRFRQQQALRGSCPGLVAAFIDWGPNSEVTGRLLTGSRRVAVELRLTRRRTAFSAWANGTGIPGRCLGREATEETSARRRSMDPSLVAEDSTWKLARNRVQGPGYKNDTPTAKAASMTGSSGVRWGRSASPGSLRVTPEVLDKSMPSSSLSRSRYRVSRRHPIRPDKYA